MTAVRALAVALSLGGGALMGHSGVHSARAATAADSPQGSSVVAAPAATSTECDKDDADKAKPDVTTDQAKPAAVTDQAAPAEKDAADTSGDVKDKDADSDKDGDKDKPDDDKDKADDDKDKPDDDKDAKDTDDTCATSGTGGVAVPPAAPLPATGSATKAASASAPLTGVPNTGSEVPFGAGLLLTTAGAAALIAGRRRRRSE
ncbi:MAG TPA: hypothetical protein VGL20_18670 [Candidatus Dormibacteraeota bacterium]